MVNVEVINEDYGGCIPNDKVEKYFYKYILYGNHLNLNVNQKSGEIINEIKNIVDGYIKKLGSYRF